MPPKPRKRKAAEKETEPEIEIKSKERKEEQKKGEGGEKVKKTLFETDEPARNYWLMKSEPKTRLVSGTDVSFSIEELMEENNQTAEWDGVRNYESRNNIKAMRAGDISFFYHSNCREPGIVGIVEIVRSAYADESQFDKASPFYDAACIKTNPKWFSVDVKFIRKLNAVILFSELKKHRGQLHGMALFNKMRLSVQPLTKAHFDFILQLDLGAKDDHQQDC